jgi:hexosaminidase
MNVADLSQRFYYSFYGRKAVSMDKVYQLLSTQAQFWHTSWDMQLAHNRTPIVGNSFGIFDTPRLVKDHTLPMLPVPAGDDLSVSSDWSYINKERQQNIARFLKENDLLMRLLKEHLETVDYQHYNLQVFFTVAQLCRQNLTMLLDLQKINQLVKLSSQVSSTHPGITVSLLDHALEEVNKIQESRNQVLQSVSTVWFRDWYPLVAEANGRKYVHQVDDVKDHPPVRTVDISYLVYRQLNYPLDKWAEQVVQARNEFARKKNLPIRLQNPNQDTAK